MTTATATSSFEEASRVLQINTDLSITPRHLQTLCHEVGDELVAQRHQCTEAFRQQPLHTPPQGASPPVPLAVVLVDGGRIQTRQADSGPGVHHPAWRETKTAVLLRMTHQPAEHDPQPELPACFAVAGGSGPSPVDSPPTEAVEPTRPRRELLFRTGLASLASSEAFGWQAAAAADRRGFFAARARAFVSDGQAYNWKIQRRHFGSFEPILDFVHAAQHVHAAAGAAGVAGCDWVSACWQGRVAEVIAAIETHQGRFSPPVDPPAEPDHPWCVLQRERGYLSNNAARMDYPRYRRAGLPITSSPVESWIKQLNRRVKGSEKFWSNKNSSEAILQLRSDWLGDEEALTKHLQIRPGHPYSRPRPAIPSAA